MKEYVGQLQGDNMTIAIVTSRFNEFIVKNLLSGALDGLKRHGVKDKDITVVEVPGAFDIPLLAKKLADTGKYQAIICLGAVIRGETPHFDYVSANVAAGIAKVSLDSQLPIIFSVLTTDTTEQALDRAGGKSGNKGFDAALAAIELVNVIKVYC